MSARPAQREVARVMNGESGSFSIVRPGSEEVGARSVLLLLLAGLLGYALVPVGTDAGPDPVPFAGSVAFALLACAAALLGRHAHRGTWLAVLPGLLYLPSVGLLRDAEGGAASGYGTLVVVPLLWVSMFGARRHVWCAVAGIGLLFVVPTLAIGGAEYPSSEWRRSTLWVSVSVLVGFAIQQMLAQLDQQRAHLARLTRRDPLTDLPNRRALDEHAAVEFARSRRTGVPVVLALLDLDHFKRYNDVNGHAAGDALLVAAARGWSERIRPTDLLARIGGEEFVLLVPDEPSGSWRAVVDRVAASVPFDQSCSIGVARWDGEEGLAQLQERADAALYAAKDAGRARVVAAPELVTA